MKLSSGYSRVDVTAPIAHTVTASSISQRVFLGGPDGKEMSVELPENFAVRPGHQLTLTWLTYPGLQGALEHVKNEATGGAVFVGAQTEYLWSSVNNAFA